VLIPILMLSLLAGCGRPTSPEASEALARALRGRMPDTPLPDLGVQAGGPEPEELEYQLQAVVHQTHFAGVREGLGLDAEHQRLLDLWWGSNTELRPDPGIDLNLQRETLARWHREQAERYGAFADALRERIARDPDDTASRGLLACSVLLLRSQNSMPIMGYPRLLLLADTVLAEAPPPEPACRLFSDDPQVSTDLTHCQVAVEDRMRIGDAAYELAMDQVDAIAASAPDSTWIEVARLLAISERSWVHTEGLTLPASRSTTTPELAIALLVSPEELLVDGLELFRLEQGRIPEDERRGDTIPRLQDRLIQKVDQAQSYTERGEEPFDHRLLLQLDRRLAIRDVQAVLVTAGQAGLVHLELVATNRFGEHVLQPEQLVVLPFSLPAIGGDPPDLSLALDASVDDLVIALDDAWDACAAQSDCVIDSFAPSLQIVP